MKIATWNVNSIKVRLPHVLDWLRANPVDVLALQELKCQAEAFPQAELEALGYRAVVNGQKTYNGVALLSKHPLQDVVYDMPEYDDVQKRVVAATANGVRVISVYVVNGESVGSEKYLYKLRWMKELRDHIRRDLALHPRLVVVGDYNVAPADEDVHDPALWAGQVLCSEPERAALRELLGLGLKDCFRLFPQADKSFTWWDYRMAAYRRNLGLRIDHILASAPLADKCVRCHIDTAPRKLERPSDHAPVVAEFSV